MHELQDAVGRALATRNSEGEITVYGTGCYPLAVLTFQIADERDRLTAETAALREKLSVAEARCDALMETAEDAAELAARLDDAEQSAAMWRNEIAGAGVEFEDLRVGYVSIQVPRGVWIEARGEGDKP